MRRFVFLFEAIIDIVKVNSTFCQILRSVGWIQHRQADTFFVNLMRNIFSLRPVRFTTSVCDYDDVLDIFEMSAVFHYHV